MRFQLFKDDRGEYRWRLISANGRIIADSAEGYKRQEGAIGAIELIKERVASAPTEWAAPDPDQAA